MNKKIKKDIEKFKASPRYAYIKATQKKAMENNLCKELGEDNKCKYPHCGCLFGTDGPIDLVGDKK